ncbi:MAG: GTPase RsgA, partial [Eggerthellaceae bacterium]
ESILPRTRAFVRKDPTERAVSQVLAANFDRVFVAQPLADVNVRRLERELVLAYETGAAVTVVLTKADLAEGEEQVASVRERVRSLVGPDVQTLVVSEDDPSSVEAVRALVPPNTTAVLIGKSGVGKSSMVNMLVGADVQETTPVRDRDGKGRHTTVSREMVDIPRGGCIVDMPGVRGLGRPIPASAQRSRISRRRPSAADSAIAATRTSRMRRARRRRVGRYQRTALRIVPGASPGDERPARAPRRGSPHARRKSLRPGKLPKGRPRKKR